LWAVGSQVTLDEPPMSTVGEELRIVFWIIPLCLQPLIALAIFLRHQTRSFPRFFLYTLFVPARDLVLLFLKRNLPIYSWAYFLSEPLVIALGLAVIYEVLWHLIRPYHTLWTVSVRLFSATLGLAALVGLTMLKTSEFGQTKFWIESLFLVERSARFVQVGVLIVFILFISHLGLTWKHHGAGIVAGFGIAAGLQLALYELRSLGLIEDEYFYLLMSMGYDVAVFVWTIYFFSPGRKADLEIGLPKTDLARWDEILRRYLNR